MFLIYDYWTYYRELRDDLDEIIEKSTSPHHLFHSITEDGDMRLHMTRRLIEDGAYRSE